jgi:hypothetical protein
LFVPRRALLACRLRACGLRRRSDGHDRSIIRSVVSTTVTADLKYVVPGPIARSAADSENGQSAAPYRSPQGSHGSYSFPLHRVQRKLPRHCPRAPFWSDPLACPGADSAHRLFQRNGVRHVCKATEIKLPQKYGGEVSKLSCPVKCVGSLQPERLYCKRFRYQFCDTSAKSSAVDCIAATQAALSLTPSCR